MEKKASLVVLMLGSVFRNSFFLFVTLSFLPTVNGQPHRGISLPKQIIWSRLRLGKEMLFVLLCAIINPPFTFTAFSPSSQLMRVFLSISILFINTFMSKHSFYYHPFIHAFIGLSVHVAFLFHICCLELNFCRFPTMLSCGVLQIIKWVFESWSLIIWVGYITEVTAVSSVSMYWWCWVAPSALSLYLAFTEFFELWDQDCFVSQCLC